LSRTFYRRQATRSIVAESAALRKNSDREFVARNSVSRDTSDKETRARSRGDLAERSRVQFLDDRFGFGGSAEALAGVG